jgi:hypothetical protein
MQCRLLLERRSILVADEVKSQSASSPAENSSKARVILAWTVVLVPLFWGVTQTLIKSAAMFQ